MARCQEGDQINQNLNWLENLIEVEVEAEVEVTIVTNQNANIILTVNNPQKFQKKHKKPNLVIQTVSGEEAEAAIEGVEAINIKSIWNTDFFPLNFNQTTYLNNIVNCNYLLLEQSKIYLLETWCWKPKSYLFR